MPTWWLTDICDPALWDPMLFFFFFLVLWTPGTHVAHTYTQANVHIHKINKSRWVIHVTSPVYTLKFDNSYFSFMCLFCFICLRFIFIFLLKSTNFCKSSTLMKCFQRNVEQYMLVCRMCSSMSIPNY